ncbi:MAG: Ribosomal RNA large subunit methyltransferase L [Burkholderia gladioli]|nr:MAG: Ribosomal RNA large subunit methyltransferase L [Burkholderia gladioli]
MPLYDPMCGSGTFLAEAAQIALAVAPGVERRFGFEKLKQYDITAWQTLKVAAVDAKRAARSRRDGLQVYGSDISGDMLDKARANIKRAGAPGVSLKQVDARFMAPPCDAPGLIIANPPYGERIEVRGRNARGEVRETGRNRGADDAFRRTHTDAPPDNEFFIALGTALKQRFTGWQAFLLTSDRSLPGLLRLRESAKTPLFNGALECRLFRFDMMAGSVRRQAGEPGADE